jgi:Zn-dependent protease
MDIDIRGLIIFFPVLLFSLTVHEFAHGWVAFKCGDDTAKRMGRLTMNPIKHLDPIGTIMMIGTFLTHYVPFGWAKPVPVDPRLFRNPKRDIMLVSLAGPVSNILTAFAAVVVAKALHFIPIPMAVEINQLLLILALSNTGLALFNLLPFAPLDGSKILIGLLPNHMIPKYLYYSHYAGIAFLIMIVAESVLKVKTISYLLTPLSNFFYVFVIKLFSSGAGIY